MRACQFCTENDPFANTVFLKKTILKFRASPLPFIFLLKDSPSKMLEKWKMLLISS